MRKGNHLQGLSMLLGLDEAVHNGTLACPKGGLGGLQNLMPHTLLEKIQIAVVTSIHLDATVV